MPRPSMETGDDPVEDSREVVDRELRRGAQDAELAPGDEAAPGTAGTGENICPVCEGSGSVRGQPCANCAGAGKIVEAIGGG